MRTLTKETNFSLTLTIMWVIQMKKRKTRLKSDCLSKCLIYILLYGTLLALLVFHYEKSVMTTYLMNARQLFEGLKSNRRISTKSTTSNIGCLVASERRRLMRSVNGVTRYIDHQWQASPSLGKFLSASNHLGEWCCFQWELAMHE